MNAIDIVKKTQQDFSQFCENPIESVTGLTKPDTGWMVRLETLERKAIPETMDVLGMCEVYVDNDGNLLSFDSKKLRKRGDTSEN